MSGARRAASRLAGVLLLLAGALSSAGAQAPLDQARGLAFTAAERQWIAQHPVVRVEFDANWKPIEYIENGKMMGLVSSYLDAVSRVSGLRFELAPTQSWGEGHEAFLDGKVDLIPALAKQGPPASLDGRLYVTTEYFISSTVVITGASEAVIFNLADLNGATVAVKRGGAYERMLRERFPKIHLLLEDSPEKALESVLAGDAEAAVDVDFAMEPLLRRRFFNQLHVSGTIADMPVVLTMGVHNNQPLLWSVLDKSLRSLTAAETDRIMHQWLERTDYGAPSYRSILRYRSRELAILALAIAGILFMAWRAWVQRRRAERSERDKARFLAVMSHEIRTPMNAILSSVELMQRTPLDGKQKRLADVATTASQTLLVLLDDVLDISKLEARRVELERLPTQIVPWASEALDVVRWRAERRGLTLTLMTGIDPSLCLRIDPTRTRQVLLNLLSNAVKFTEQGGVTVRLSYAPAPKDKDGKPGTLQIDVADTGIGIAPQDQRGIFNAFQQADSSTTRRFGGTGLGLTISRELVRLMRGKIELQSTPGVGTVFTVRIPAEVAPLEAARAVVAHPAPERVVTLAPEPVAPPPQGVRAGAATPRPRVLVVDDHPTNLMVLEQQLRTLHCDADLAAGGQQALDKAAAQPFHLILMDCHLPDIDGYTVAERIRAREAQSGAHTPILAISAATDEAHQQRVMASGMDGMLTKPIRLDALRDMIELWCDAGGDAITAAQAPAAAPAGVDRDLWSIYLDSLDDDLESLADALGAGDPARARHVAHRIKGAALTVGQAAIADEARALEGALAQASTIPADAPAALARLRGYRDALHADSAVH